MKRASTDSRHPAARPATATNASHRLIAGDCSARCYSTRDRFIIAAPMSLKICFLSEPHYLHTRRWASFFADRGHDVHIVAGGPDIDARPLRDVTTHPLDDRPFKGPWTLRTTLALGRRVRTLRPDILHMHYLWALPAPIFLRFRPFLVSVWGADILGKTGLAPERRQE